MRIGLGPKIVLTVVAVLVAAFAVIAAGFTQIEAVAIIPNDRPNPALPDPRVLAHAYRAGHSWDGTDAFLVTLAAKTPNDLLIVREGRVRASSRMIFAKAFATPDGARTVRITTTGNRSGAPSFVLNGVPTEPIIVNGVVVGQLCAVARLPSATQSAFDAARAANAVSARRFLSLVAIVAAGALLVAMLLAAHIVRPVRELTAATRAAGGTAFPRVAVRSDDEIGELARSFNALGEHLAASESARRSILSDVTHELLTPLTNIRCELESLADGITVPTTAAVQSVLREVLLLQRLMSDLHALRAADAAPMPLNPAPTNLVGTVWNTITAFADRADERGVRVTLRAPERPVTVVCDPLRVRQVVHNLLDNALRYGRRDGRIEVAIRSDGQSVRVDVHDDGDGFAADQEARIFERFYRIDASRARSTGGSGLGLAIAKHLVEAHGGTIGANGGDGSGATLWFTLPLLSQMQTPSTHRFHHVHDNRDDALALPHDYLMP